jgi:hypothetical protein
MGGSPHDRLGSDPSVTVADEAASGGVSASLMTAEFEPTRSTPQMARFAADVRVRLDIGRIVAAATWRLRDRLASFSSYSPAMARLRLAERADLLVSKTRSGFT